MNSFDKLNTLNVNGHTEKKGNLTYLSWAWAWAEVKKIYPNAAYEIKKFEGGMPYLYDENTGYMVFTSVTIEDLTYEMWLPVMDYRNAAMKTPTMTDINKTIMRCLVKNLAMFGLGLYIYAGEDLPENERPPEEPDTSSEPLSEAQLKNIKGMLSLHPDKGKVLLQSIPVQYGYESIDKVPQSAYKQILDEAIKQTQPVLKAKLNESVTAFMQKSGQDEATVRSVLETAMGKPLDKILIPEYRIYCNKYKELYDALGDAQ